VSFGSGCDALHFEVTDRIGKLPRRMGVQGYLANQADLPATPSTVCFGVCFP